ncbi:MAG: DUF4954 family protein [Spirochaetaceae bacterium]|nr:MAG: DUF4954 family protein [Spirochaetaceae bacterium]
MRNSVLQYGSHVDTQAIVDHSFLAEYSGASRHGKITESFIGPNTHVAEGEVTASFVGPFVGFHHQALLIAAWWPEGRGNIAYGANIGSNHTGKLADQEIFPGEGTFFGLSSSVKFPANLREAPYSIIATSVTMLAQKLLFPFSLVNSPSRTIKGIPPAFNEIFPGWIISENIYSLLRNSDKYVKRNKARRVSFDFSPWRPDLVLLAHKAKTLLESASGKEFYTDKEIPGLGKNFLTEENRIAGITAYSFYCDYFCRETLFALLKDNPKAFAELGKSSGKTGTIPHEIAVQIFAHNEEIADSTLLLQNLKHQKKEIQRMLLSSKSRDDKRGEKIIDDYTSVHLKTEDDSFIKDYSARLEKEIAALS